MTYSIGSAAGALRTVPARRPSEPDSPAAASRRSSPHRSWSAEPDAGTGATASTTTTAPTATITQATTAQPQKQPSLKEIVRGLLRTLDTEAIPNCGFQRPHRSMSTVHRLVDVIATSRIASVMVHLPDFLVDGGDADSQAAAGSEPMSEARVSTALSALDDPHSGASADKGCGTHTKASLLDALSLVARASIKRDLRAAEAARMTREALLIAYANRPTQPAATATANATASATPSTSTAAAPGMPPSASRRSDGVPASWMPSRSLKRTRSDDGGFPVRFPRIGAPHSVHASQAEPVSTLDRSTPGARPTSPGSDSRSTSPDMPAWTIPRHHPAPARFARSIGLSVEKPRYDEVGLDPDQTKLRQLLEANGGSVPDGFRLDFPLAIDSPDARQAKRKNNTAAIDKMFAGPRRIALGALSAINDMFQETRPVFTTPGAVRKAAKADAQPTLATHAASVGDRNTTAGVADERYETPFGPSRDLAVLAAGGSVIQRRSQTFPPAALDMLHEHGLDPDRGFTFTIPRHVYNDGPESDVRRINTHALLKSRDDEKSDSQVAAALGRLNAQFENAPFVAHLAFERRRQRLFERSGSDSTG